MESNTDNPILSYRSGTVIARLPDTPQGTPRCQCCGGEMEHTATIAPKVGGLKVYECRCNPGNYEYRIPKSAA